MIILLFLVILSSCSSYSKINSPQFNSEIVEHKFYSLDYNEEHEIPNWVAYNLKNSHLKSCTKRPRGGLKEDDLVSTGSATDSDYKGSGYDRGHMVPAGDMKHSRTAMRETFYASNFTPQPSRFNQQIWNQLENVVRSWAYNYGDIRIVSGPFIDPGMRTIGRQNTVSVPRRYYKSVARYNQASNSWITVSYLIPTNYRSKNLHDYVISTDELEAELGYRVFPDISREEKSNYSRNNWPLNLSYRYSSCRSNFSQY